MEIFLNICSCTLVLVFLSSVLGDFHTTKLIPVPLCDIGLELASLMGLWGYYYLITGDSAPKILKTWATWPNFDISPELNKGLSCTSNLDECTIMILVETKSLHSYTFFIALAEHHLILREFMLPILSTQHPLHVGRNFSEEKVQSNILFQKTSVTVMCSVLFHSLSSFIIKEIWMKRRPFHLKN